MKIYINIYIAIVLVVLGCGGEENISNLDPKSNVSGGGPVSTPSPSFSPTATLNESLFPLEENNEWTYEITGNGKISWCQIPTSKTRVNKIIGKKIVNDSTRFQMQGTICNESIKTEYSVEGYKVKSYSMGYEYIILDKPSHEAPFAIGQTNYIWLKLGSYSSKAGNFENCWKLEMVGGTSKSHSIYCGGVGVVEYFVKDPSQNSLTAILVKKNF